jgi:hypothetical protein
MKDYKELKLIGTPESLSTLLSDISSEPLDGWMRNRDLEKRLPADGLRSGFYCFTCDEKTVRRSAHLWLAPKNDAEYYYVTNIIPNQGDRLSFDDYNEVLSSFAIRLRASKLSNNVQVIEEGGSLFLDSFLSQEVLTRLRRFSGAANKATGSAHHYDKERWFAFVVAAHSESSGLHSSDLLRWLLEEEHWPEDQALELVIEYEQQRSLLEYYDKTRQ